MLPIYPSDKNPGNDRVDHGRPPATAQLIGFPVSQHGVSWQMTSEALIVRKEEIVFDEERGRWLLFQVTKSPQDPGR